MQWGRRSGARQHPLAQHSSEGTLPPRCCGSSSGPSDSGGRLPASPVTGLSYSHGPSHLPEHADQGQLPGDSLRAQSPSRDYGGVKLSLFSVRADSPRLCGPHGLCCSHSTWPPPRRIRHRPQEKGRGLLRSHWAAWSATPRSDHKNLPVPQPGSTGSRRALFSTLRPSQARTEAGAADGARARSPPPSRKAVLPRPHKRALAPHYQGLASENVAAGTRARAPRGPCGGEE